MSYNNSDRRSRGGKGSRSHHYDTNNFENNRYDDSSRWGYGQDDNEPSYKRDRDNLNFGNKGDSKRDDGGYRHGSSCDFSNRDRDFGSYPRRGYEEVPRRNQKQRGRGHGHSGGYDNDSSDDRNGNHEEPRSRGRNNRGRGNVNVETPSVSAEVRVEEGLQDATFDSFNLLPELLKAVNDLGYKVPTPIQQRAIPHVLAGRDVLAGAQTGTGKTAAFALPILHKLYLKRRFDGILVLVLTPTRELAAQIEESFNDLGKYLPKLNTTVIFGGVGQAPQVSAIKSKPSVLVATPGRLLDLHSQGHLDFGKLEFLVLDEADRMLDMGFFPDVSKILKLLPRTKQTLLFSATFSGEIRNLANSLLIPPVSEVQVTPPNSTVERIHQTFYIVGRNHKNEALHYIITNNKWCQVLVFTRTKHGANSVADMLSKSGISAQALHGGKGQSARTKALSDFKSGNLRVLVATDIAARGLDIEDLPHVVNYEIPNVSEDYIHRIGRTGRAGKEGYAVSLVSLDEEGFMNNIMRFAKIKVELGTDMPIKFGADVGEKAEPIAMGQMTLWGGAGPAPPRSVMDAAGKAARREIANRIRERRGEERNIKLARQNVAAAVHAEQSQHHRNHYAPEQVQQPRREGGGYRGGGRGRGRGNRGGGRGGY